MKRLLLFFMVISPALAFSQNRMPDYKSALTKFFSLYHHENSVEEFLVFAKKKDGWHVRVIDQTKHDTVVSDQLFWSWQKGRYQVLENFVRATADPVDKKVDNQVSTAFYFPYSYERCVYYGYDGWDADIIHDFENIAMLPTDTLYESLARAYSSYYTRYTWYQYGGQPLPHDTLQRKLGRLEMPGDERVKKIVEYAEKAIASYEKIYQRNKAYQTFSGNIESKLFDETFHAYFQLMLCNRPVEAEHFLAKCRLPAKDSLYARGMFGILAPNAILFTFGDNDTYPLLYLQEKLNLRKDVTVVHASMLGLAAYIDLIKRNDQVRFVSTAGEYGKKDFDYIFFSRQPSGKKIKISEFISSRKTFNRVPTIGGDSVQVFNEKLLYMPFSKSPAAGIPPALRDDSLQIQLPEAMYMNEYILLDIISANLSQRPIFFTSPWPIIPSENMLRTGDLLQLAPARRQ